MLMKEADQLQKVDQDCRTRVLKLHDLLGKQRNDVLDRKLRDITLECRWATLHARDRVLEALKPEGAAALVDQPGSLAQATRRLAKAGINVESALPIVSGVWLSQKWPLSSSSKRSRLNRIGENSPSSLASFRPTPTNP